MRNLIGGVLLVCFCAMPARAEKLYGLTNLQQIVTFDSQTRLVTQMTSPVGFSILGESLRSIDVRPDTGELYGLSAQNNVYVIDPITGASTQIGSTLSPGPTGAFKAINFNPTVDRLRVLSSANDNFRVHPVTGAVMVDASLAFAAGDVNQGDTPFIVNGAYTNSFTGATTTTLYDIDATNDVLVTQTPANNGTLQTVGSLGFNIPTSGGFTGFDISGSTGLAFLVGNSLTGGGLTSGSLYQVNLATGQATLLGAVSGVNGSFRDIAVAAPAVVPEPGSIVLGAFGLLALGFVWWRHRNLAAEHVSPA